VDVLSGVLPSLASPAKRLFRISPPLPGARWHQIEDDDPARAIVGFAREHQITQIVIGNMQHSWWHIPGGGPIVRQVI
jgi:K+-sensing histidine kinase KdpD